MNRVGFVSIDSDQSWIGGRYYLHHLIRANAMLPVEERLSLCEIRWGSGEDRSAFDDVRDLLGEPLRLVMPTTPVARVRRRIKRFLTRSPGAADLFRAERISAVFPVAPCENPGIPLVYWLPDFQYLRRPDLLSADLRQAFETLFRTNVGRSTRIVLSSNDALTDFAQVFPDRIADARVVRFASLPDSSWWRHDPAATATRYGLPDRFLIACNQFTRHKNHGVLVEALGRLRETRRESIVLAFTGSLFDHRGEHWADQIRTRVRALGLTSDVHILGLIPREDQIALIRRAVAVLQPSSFEGWSTVIEDAKTLAKPLVVSDLRVHREQLGAEAVAFLREDDIDGWAQVLDAVWRSRDPGPVGESEKLGQERATRSALECGRQFGVALREAIASGPR